MSGWRYHGIEMLADQIYLLLFLSCPQRHGRRFNFKWSDFSRIKQAKAENISQPKLEKLCRVGALQCDQIWRFIGLWATF